MNQIDVGKILQFQHFGDVRGDLVVVEGCKDIPFNIKRIFYMYNFDINYSRGGHANKYSSFVFINLSGSVKITVSDSNNISTYILQDKMEGLYIPNMIWKDIQPLKNDTILLVLSDQIYDKNEYIYDFEDYSKFIKSNIVKK